MIKPALSCMVESLRQSEYFKSVTTLMTGSVLSQIIPLLASPFIARLYSPNDYAVLAAYSSVALLLTMAATGSYDTALMIDHEDCEAINTGCTASIITLIITFLALIIIIAFKDAIVRLTANDNVSCWLYFIPLTVLFSGINQTLTIWNNRKKRFKRLASNRIILTSCTTTLTLILGLYGLKEKGLLISMIVGQTIAFLILLGLTIHNDKNIFKEINIRRMKQSVVKHSDFPKYNMPQAFFDGIRESGIILIISNYFGAYSLGSFSFARSMIMKPLQLIGSAVAQVFYQKASCIYNQSRALHSVTKKTLFMLCVIGFPFSLLILIWGDKLFAYIFSVKWMEAGIISQILVPWLFLRFIGSPLSTIPLIMNKQKTFFYYSLFSNYIPVATLFVAGYAGMTFTYSLISFSAASGLTLLFMIIWFYTLSYTEFMENK